jgi:hypothetical protein
VCAGVVCDLFMLLRMSIIGEILHELRDRFSLELRDRTEERVKPWEKVEAWVAGHPSRVWVVRLSCNILCFYSCGIADVDRYRFLLCPSHDAFPRLGLRTF